MHLPSGASRFASLSWLKVRRGAWRQADERCRSLETVVAAASHGGPRPHAAPMWRRTVALVEPVKYDRLRSLTVTGQD